MNMNQSVMSQEVHANFAVSQADYGTTFGVPAPSGMSVQVFAKNNALLQRVSKFYKFDPDLLRSVLSFIFTPSNGDALLLYGPLGCGKTTLIREILGRLRWPTIMLEWFEQSDSSDLYGSQGMSFGNTKFEEGPLVVAARYGYALVINEIDRGRAGNLVALNGLLDGGQILIKETGEVIKPHPNFRLICTANSAGSGDMTGAYTGSVRKLDPAFLDRFMMIEVGYMKPADELDMLLVQFPDYAEASSVFMEMMCGFAYETRMKATDIAAELSVALSTRALVRFFRYGRSYNLPQKIKANPGNVEQILPTLGMTYLNRLSPAEREVAEQLLRMKLA